MSRAEQAIFTVLCMLEDGNGNILLQDRNDPGWPGVCFPGGHVEEGESFTRAAIREMQEETGLTVLDPHLCGVKQFQTKYDQRYVVFFYKATRYSGVLTSSDEGEVFWHPRAKLEELTLVEDFTDMVRVFESEELSEFYYHKNGDDWRLALL